MSKKRKITLAVIAAVLALLTTLGVLFLRSPEYALLRMALDVKESGYEGLRPHLTEELQKPLDMAISLKDSKLAGVVMGLFLKKEEASQESLIDKTAILEKLQEIQWGLEDFRKTRWHATITISFRYEDKLAGTIDVSMKRQDDGWKISGISWPTFDINP